MRQVSKVRCLVVTSAMLVITAAGTGMTGAAADPNPSIDLSESTGPVGTVFAANSCGWLENLPIQVSQTGLEEMGPPQENKSDNYGCFNKTFRVKNDTPPGYVTIEYRQAERIRTQANFEVQGR